ncbi:MAG: thioredoxin domain-containing protein, partial [Gammaproteobacteria bacterium]
LSEPRYLDAAEATLKAGFDTLQNSPLAHAGMATALAEWLSPPLLVVLRGSEKALARVEQARSDYAPDLLVFPVPSEAQGLPAALQEKEPSAGIRAYPCRGMACSPPREGMEAVLELLGAD